MVRLREILDMSFAHKFHIRIPSENKIVFKGEKYTPEYNKIKEQYGDWQVIGIRARPFDGGTICFDIDNDDLFL